MADEADLVDFQDFLLPSEQKARFLVTGWANVPLNMNWTKACGYYGDAEDNTYRGWLLDNEDKPRFCEGLEALATPGVFPLDATTIHGIHCGSQRLLSSAKLDQQHKEKEYIRYVPLLFLYDFELMDPTKTRVWRSREAARHFCNTKNCQDFVQVDWQDYCCLDTLKARIKRYVSKIKKVIG